jgi:hypothetical protein
MDTRKVNQCVEALCLNGCEIVNATIAALEQDLPVTQIQDLDNEERQAVLRELKSIMAVYDSSSQSSGK